MKICYVIIRHSRNRKGWMTKMDNRKLMEKLQYLWNKKTITSEDSNRCSAQSSLIMNVFDIKTDEINKPIEDFYRMPVLSDDDIKKKFEVCVRNFKHDKEHDDRMQWESMFRMLYFIDAVRFFNPELAEKLKIIMCEFI